MPIILFCCTIAPFTSKNVSLYIITLNYGQTSFDKRNRSKNHFNKEQTAIQIYGQSLEDSDKYELLNEKTIYHHKPLKQLNRENVYILLLVNKLKQ